MSNGLPDEAFTKQRDESMSQAVKGLFIINGGAALALLAFFKDVWSARPDLAASMLKSMSLLVIGVALAGSIHLLRYVASFHYQTQDGSGPTYRTAFLILAWCSLSMFCFGVVWLIGGMWSVLLGRTGP